MSTTHDYEAEAKSAITALKIDLTNHQWTVDDLARGIEVEYEHGTVNPLTNVTNDDPMMTAKIALAHLLEDKEKYKMQPTIEHPAPNQQYDYYDGLEVIEGTPPGYWRGVTSDSFNSRSMGIKMAFIIIILLIIITVFTLGYKLYRDDSLKKYNVHMHIMTVGLLSVAAYNLY